MHWFTVTYLLLAASFCQELPLIISSPFSTRTHTRMHAVNQLIDGNRLPHLLFYGPPGTGKTSTILACARKIHGGTKKNMVLEVSCCTVFPLVFIFSY